LQTLNDVPDLRIDGPVATVRLRRPRLANRLSVADIETLLGFAERLQADATVRLVLLRGEGAHFCAGFQIDAVGEVDAPALFERLTDTWEGLRPLTLAVVHGDVWGGAVDWALACDFRLGGASGRLGIPAARLGLHFYGSGLQRLISRLGLSAAKRMLLAGEVWEGAQRAPFFDEQAEPLEALVARWQERLLALAPLAQQGMKRHLNTIARGALDPQALAHDQALCAASADLAEGLAAWQAQRAPRFRAR
jgi:enoyl-CoA hydratase/carnithine racemase